MSGPTQRQFVELRDLSPLEQNNHRYDGTGYDDRDGVGSDDDTHFVEEHLDSDQTYHENDSSSQSPIIGNEKQTKIRRRKAWKEQNNEVRVTRAGRMYRKIRDCSFVVRWLLCILPVALILAVPIIVGIFKTGAELGGVRILWLFLWIEVVWIALWVSKLVARLLPCK